jgi:hypothetical protein
VGADHKGPLAAFVVIAIIAAVLLVTSVRSQADDGWLAVHRLITGHHSSTLDAGSSTPAGVRQPSAAPTSASATTGDGTTDRSAALGATQATPSATDQPTSTTSGHTSHPLQTRDAASDPAAHSSDAPDAPSSLFPTGLPDPSALPDPIQALGGGPEEPFPPITGPTGSPTAQPDLRWPFERPQWLLGTWTRARWLSLLEAHHRWYVHPHWYTHHHWSH